MRDRPEQDEFRGYSNVSAFPVVESRLVDGGNLRAVVLRRHGHSYGRPNRRAR